MVLRRLRRNGANEFTLHSTLNKSIRQRGWLRGIEKESCFPALRRHMMPAMLVFLSYDYLFPGQRIILGLIEDKERGQYELKEFLKQDN